MNKSKAKILKVQLWDGSIVKEKNATETYIEVIRRLDPEKISMIPELLVEGLPLVVAKEDYRLQINKVDDNWYVSTHMGTNAKKRMLERIARLLGKKIIVSIQ